MSELCPVLHTDPTTAEVGRLCLAHAEGIERDALALIEVYQELVEPRSTGPALRITGTPERRIPYVDAVGDARDNIRRVLASWARLIVDERRVTAPSLDIWHLAGFVARHWRYLAAHDLAVFCVEELRELAVGAPCRAAYPFNTVRRIQRLGPCPERVQEGAEPCGMPTTAILRGEASPYASEVICEEGHAFPVGRVWLDLAPMVSVGVTVAEAAVALYGDAGMADLVRQHISRGRLTRRDDGLIELDDVRALAAEYGLGSAA